MPHSRRRPSRPRWKTALLGCGIGCGTALVLGFLAIAIVFHKLTAVPPEVARTDRAAQQAVPPTDPSGQVQPPPPPYETQRQEAERAAQSGVPTPVTVRLTEGQINDVIAQNTGPNPDVQNVRVAFTGSDLLLTGTTQLRGRSVYITAVGRPQAVGGQPRFQLYSVRVGTLGMPASGLAKLQAEIDRGMADWSAKNPYEVSDVSIAGGQLVISGTTRPR